MNIIHITGLRYNWVNETDLAKANTLVEEKLRALPLGTRLLLQLEPNNPVTPARGSDKGAVQAFDEDFNLIGRVSNNYRETVHKLMSEHSVLEASYAGSDGHVTMYASIEGLEETSETLNGLTRKLPATPLTQIPLQYTPEEDRLRMMTHSLLKPDLTTAESRESYLKLVEKYLPLSALSICKEDSLLRVEVINTLSALLADRSLLDAEQVKQAKELLKQLRKKEGDFHRHTDGRLEQIFRCQLNALQHLAEGDDKYAFFRRFDDLYKEGTRANVLDKLRQWLEGLPWKKSLDYTNLGVLAEELVNMSATRSDVYDVLAVLLLLKREQEQQEEAVQNFTPEQEKILGRLDTYIDKGDWQEPATAENIKSMMRSVLSQPEADTLWKLLKHRRGNPGNKAVMLTWANLAGYFQHHGLLNGDSAQLSKDFFDKKDQTDNINKGKPGNTTSKEYESILGLLDSKRPKEKVEKNKQ